MTESVDVVAVVAAAAVFFEHFFVFFSTMALFAGFFFAAAAEVFFFFRTFSVKTSTSVTLTPYGLLMRCFFANVAACFGARYLATISSTAVSD